MLPSLCPKLVGWLILVMRQSGVLCRSRQGATLLPSASSACPMAHSLAMSLVPVAFHHIQMKPSLQDATAPSLVPLQECGFQSIPSSPLNSLSSHLLCFSQNDSLTTFPLTPKLKTTETSSTSPIKAVPHIIISDNS